MSVSEPGAGALNVTKVTVGGQTLVKDQDYTVTDNGSSTPDITFTPAPAANAQVCVYGTTAGGEGTYSATVDWD